MKTIVSLILAFAMPVMAANYTDAGVEVGFRQQNGSVNTTGADEKAKTGFQLGVSGAFPISDSLSFRTGMFYVEKSIKVETATTSDDLKFTYFQVPATLMFKFMENAGGYVGVNIDVNLSDDCGSSNCKDVKSLTTPLVLGTAFKFAPQLGANVFFESGSGEVAKGVKDFKAVGVNLIIAFE